MKKKKSHRRKARKSYVSNPAPRRRRRRRRSSRSVAAPAMHHRRRRSYRKNPGDTVKDIMILGGSALVGALVGGKVAGMIPVPPMAQNLGLAAAGAALAYFGRRKTPLIGVGVGMAIAGLSKVVVNQFPQLAGDDELTPEEQRAVIDELSNLSGEDDFEDADYSLSGPLAGPLSGPLSGFNSPSM